MLARTRKHRTAAPFVAACTLLLLTGCGLYQRPTSDDREAQADCSREADRIFSAQHRELLSEHGNLDAPNAANTLPSNPSAGLSDRYQQDQLYDSCLARSAAGSPNPTPASPTP
jgi:hypothetical protein